MRIKASLFFVCFHLVAMLANGQHDRYQFKRSLSGVSEDWHRIDLPNDLFGRVKNDMSDIRIVGINASGDTIETPYFIEHKGEQTVEKNVNFQIINESRKGSKYFFTFEINSRETINEMELDFKKENFDWRIVLEGSQDQKEWFTIIEDYRILSIKNLQMDYHFTKVNFAASSYGFYRIQLESKEKPELNGAFVKMKETREGSFRTYNLKSSTIHEVENEQATQIDIDLGLKVPTNNLFVEILNQFDYYRPVIIQYLSDSFETEKGWKYSYTSLASGTVSSLEKTPFFFHTTMLRKIRVRIENQDNEALSIGKCVVSGYNYELIARFLEEADYFLIYGNPNARKPNYDIQHFKDNVPAELTQLNLGNETPIVQKELDARSPLFENKIWLWAILLILIAFLGYYSIRMLKKA